MAINRELLGAEVRVELNDRDATSGLRRLEADYRAAMARIDRMEAEATIDVDTRQFDAKMKKEEDRIKLLKAEKADLKIGANTKEIDRKILIVQRRIDRLKGEKAEIEIGTRGERETLATIETVRKAEAARAAAAERYANARTRMLADEVRAGEKRRQIARQSQLDEVKSERQVASLRREYARLDGELDKLTKKYVKSRSGLGGLSSDQKIRFSIDGKFLQTRMEEVKKQLEFLGGHPPVQLDVRFDDRTIRQRFAGLVKNLARRGDTRISLGPITTSVRTLIVAGTALSSVVTSLIGSATALAGVLGTGLAGAIASASGLISGLVLNLGGLATTLVPAIKNFKLATAATKAHDQAVAKYGADSKQAITAQRQLNSVVGQLDPNSRKALRSFNALRDSWQKLTGQTAQRNVGKVLQGGTAALTRLVPILARNTNEASNILTTALTRWEAAAGSRGGQSIFGSLGRSANKFLADALPGIDHLGAAFAHIAESAARLFAGPAGTGFAKWAADIDKATQPGKRLDDQMTRLRKHATDLLHFFSALGRLLVTVLNGGADAGDNLVQHMTRALDKWNQFLRTPRGQQGMAKFFSDSEKNTRALFNALTPLVALFVRFSQIFQPITTGALRVLDIIGSIAAAAGSLEPVRKSLEAIGGALAALLVYRKTTGLFKSIFGSASTAGIQAQMISGGKLAGEEIASAMVAAGRVVGGEVAAGEEAGGLGGAAGAGRGGLLSRLGGKAGALRLLGPVGVLAVGTIAAGKLIQSHHTTGTASAQNAAGADVQDQGRRGHDEAQAYQRAYDNYMRSHQGFTRGQGAAHYKEVVDGARKAGRDAAQQLSAGFDRQNLHQSLGTIRQSISALARSGAGDMHSLRLAFEHNAALIEGSLTTHTQAGKNAAARNIGAMITAIDQAMRRGRVSTDSGMSQIKKLMNRHTGAGASIVADNMEKIVRSIRSAMRRGDVAAETGNRLIHQAFTRAFEALGLSASDIKGLGPKTTPQDLLNRPALPNPSPGAGHNKAGGGFIGNRGERGRDTEVALLGRGEAVLNRHQQAPVDYALQSTYGMTLDDLFGQVTTPHYYAAGGRARGVSPAVARAGALISRKFGLSVTSTTGGQHAPGSYHYLGEAEDIAGPAGAMYRAAQWIKSSGMARSLAEGIHNPNLSIKNGRSVSPGFWGATTWANHINHIHIAIAGALGRLAGTSAQHINAPRVQGSGLLAGLVRGGLRQTTRAANARLRRAARSVGGGDSFDISPGRGKFGFGALERLWTRAGGSPAVQAIMAHIAQAESGGDPNAHNASGATGLWQILGALVPGNLYNPLVNARNAVAKLRTQGLGAWAASRPVWGKYLARGGRMRGYARGRRGGPSARITAKHAKSAPKGKHHTHKRIKPLKGFEKLTSQANYYVNERIPALEELYSNAERTFDLTPEEYIVTPAGGGASYIDWHAVGRRKEELSTLIRMKIQIRNATTHAVRLLNRILALRNERKRLKERLDQMQREYDKLQKEIHHLQRTRTGVHGKGSTGEHRRLSGEILDKTNRSSDLRKQIVGTKQQLADWDTTMDDAQSNLVSFEGVSGRGGALGDTKFDISSLRSQLAEIDPTALTTQLTEQNAGQGPTEDTQAELAQQTQNAANALVAQHVAEAALQVFTGSGDIGARATSAYQAALGHDFGGGRPAIGGPVLGGGVLARNAASGAILSGAAASSFVTGSGIGSSGGGIASRGDQPAGGTTVIQNINTLHPGDPATLRAIGDAASSGFSYQGFRSSSVTRLGY
jgi:hypothetical protein